MRIAGSLWSVPPAQQPGRLKAAVSAGLPVVHWDATDGVFAAAGGFTPAAATRLLANVPEVESEAHLMMHDPLPTIPAWAEFCSTIVIPVEIEDVSAALDRIVSLGVTPGVAASLQTPLDKIPKDLPVLLMAITPGQAGSPFDPAVLDRIQRLRERGHMLTIGVDGGVKTEHFAALHAAGATWVISGTGLFSAPDIRQWLAQCQASFTRGTEPTDG